MTTVTDSANNVWVREHDLLGRVVRMVDPVGRWTRLEYTSTGTLSRVVDSTSHTIDLEHDF